ncbi:MAG TPA: DUF1015 domain-containing protein [Candidatus Anammoximicrobium sp.]|nr:DUF1015 domain-containing protein [Candidatus Anammoximicrobium sp.]
MPEIQAFRALRYDLGHVGALSDVVAPPYDVIGPELQDQLYKKHPANVIRLILNRDEPGDDDAHNRYTRAARFLKNWCGEGLLQRDPDPALYVYHQTFQYGGRAMNRRGFMARIRLERFGEGNIYPHEETHAAAKADRFKLTVACKANLSQIFGLYPDEENAAQEILERAVLGTAPLEAVDHLGVIHRMWPVSDVKVIAEVAAVLGPKPMFIADGHHRYETACNYRDHLSGGQTLPASHPANFVLGMCVSMSDPGMVVLPTHRLFRGLPPLSSAQLIEKLGDCFQADVAAQGPDAAHAVWESIEIDGEQGVIGFFTTADQQWVLARITAAGRQRMAEVATDHGPDWQQLGVSILHRLVMETLLDAKQLPKAEYVHLVEEAVDWLHRGDVSGQPFPLAALVMPATVEHVRKISESQQRMPAKSTYFYPKLLSGLVINPLE